MGYNPTERNGGGRSGCRLGRIHTQGTDAGGDTRFKLVQGCAGCVPVVREAQAAQIFEQGVDGSAQGAGEQAAFVAGVELSLPAFRGGT